MQGEQNAPAYTLFVTYAGLSGAGMRTCVRAGLTSDGMRRMHAQAPRALPGGGRAARARGLLHRRQRCQLPGFRARGLRMHPRQQRLATKDRPRK
jgi:hypothetical protein